VTAKRHEQVDFLGLDMTLQRVTRTGTTAGRVLFRPYRKPGNACAYIPFTSFHGRHTFRGWVLAELLRLMTHSSTPELWKEEGSEAPRRRGSEAPKHRSSEARKLRSSEAPRRRGAKAVGRGFGPAPEECPSCAGWLGSTATPSPQFRVGRRALDGMPSGSRAALRNEVKPEKWSKKNMHQPFDRGVR
jgi:hypothetical protein